MKKTIYKIREIEACFNEINDGQGNDKAEKFSLKNIIKAKKSGKSGNKISHHQGICKLNGIENYLITGSRKSRSGYLYFIKNGIGSKVFNGNDYWEKLHPIFTHPGGIQVAENILAIGFEQYKGFTTFQDRSFVRFYDISNIENIIELKHLEINRFTNGIKKIASAIGITKLNNQWIVGVRGKKSIDFFTLEGNIMNPTNQFKSIGSLDIKTFKLEEFQSFQLFIDEKDDIYSIGMPKGSSTKDKCWLHKINFKIKANRIKKVKSAKLRQVKHFKRNGKGPRFCHGSSITFNAVDPNLRPDEASNQPVKGYFELISISKHVDDNSIRANRWKGIEPISIPGGANDGNSTLANQNP